MKKLVWIGAALLVMLVQLNHSEASFVFAETVDPAGEQAAEVPGQAEPETEVPGSLETEKKEQETEVPGQPEPETEVPGQPEPETEVPGQPEPTPTSQRNIIVVKAGWRKLPEGMTYRYSNGNYAHGVICINKIFYALSGSDPANPGYLMTGKKNRVKWIDGNYYLVNKKGQCVRKGWHIWKHKGKDGYKTLDLLYFKGEKNASVSGKKIKDSTTKGVTFGNDGLAKKNICGRIKIMAMDIMNRIAGKKMKKSKKLRKAFSYMISHKNFSYVDYSANMKKKDWEMYTAEMMFNNGGGSCDNFACAFAALAREIGYRPYVIATRVHGSRDHARDGFTRHKLVKIKGRYYDPEGRFAGWLRGSGYALRSYPVATKTWKSFAF